MPSMIERTRLRIRKQILNPRDLVNKLSYVFMWTMIAVFVAVMVVIAVQAYAESLRQGIAFTLVIITVIAIPIAVPPMMRWIMRPPRND